MALVHRTGELFAVAADTDPAGVALAHGCNCAGAMGAGIAVAFRHRWPAMHATYRQACADGTLTVGQVLPWQDPTTGRWIYNLGTQAHYRVGATLAAITGSVGAATRHAEQVGVTGILMPRIGSGLGGLRPAAVEQALLELAATTPVHLGIVTLPDGPPPGGHQQATPAHTPRA